MIDRVFDQDEVLYNTQEQVGALFSAFYSKLLSSSNPTTIEECLQAMEPCVS